MIKYSWEMCILKKNIFRISRNLSQNENVTLLNFILREVMGNATNKVTKMSQTAIKMRKKDFRLQ